MEGEPTKPGVKGGCFKDNISSRKQLEKVFRWSYGLCARLWARDLGRALPMYSGLSEENLGRAITCVQSSGRELLECLCGKLWAEYCLGAVLMLCRSWDLWLESDLVLVVNCTLNLYFK